MNDLIDELPLDRDPLPHVISAVGDMGQGLKLELMCDGDGDITVSILPINHRFSDAAVEFCVPGTGGGRSPRTFAALQNLMRAMVADAKERGDDPA